jgi:succinoglycan biosynthesis protein ExoA
MGTRDAIAAFQRDFPDLEVRLVDNTLRTIPSGLNRALEAARGEIIVRLDAAFQAVSRLRGEMCRRPMKRDAATMSAVSGRSSPARRPGVAKSIAVAASHPLGVGDAMYRLAASAAEVDTVPFGSYRRTLIERIGGYNESLLTMKIMSSMPASANPADGSGSTRPSAPFILRVHLWGTDPPVLALRLLEMAHAAELPGTLRWRQALAAPVCFEPGRPRTCIDFSSPCKVAAGRGIHPLFSVLLLAGLHAAIKHRKPFLLPGLPWRSPPCTSRGAVDFCGVCSHRVRIKNG